MNANNSPPVLTQQELETPRTAADMLAWVDSAHARFNTKQLKAEARDGKHLARELLDEARPIALFASRYYQASAQVTISYTVGDQNYDAIVTDNRAQPEAHKYLEATTTLVTYEEALRMELLSKQGHAAAYGRVVPGGPKHKRVAIKAEGIAHDHEMIVAEHLQRVEDAVRRKAKKNYHPNTVLIVAVDDSVPFRDQGDIDRLKALAAGTLVPALKGSNFSMLALEGSHHVHLVFAP